MVVEDVRVERTPRAYFRWVASTPDSDVSTRGPTPATALYRLHDELDADANGDLDVDGDLDVERKPSL